MQQIHIAQNMLKKSNEVLSKDCLSELNGCIQT